MITSTNLTVNMYQTLNYYESAILYVRRFGLYLTHKGKLLKIEQSDDELKFVILRSFCNIYIGWLESNGNLERPGKLLSLIINTYQRGRYDK